MSLAKIVRERLLSDSHIAQLVEEEKAAVIVNIRAETNLHVERVEKDCNDELRRILAKQVAQDEKIIDATQEGFDQLWGENLCLNARVKELEEKVASLTRELDAANRELRALRKRDPARRRDQEVEMFTGRRQSKP